MKAPPFTYHRPPTLDEALALLAEHGDDAKVLAGGQSLIPLMALRLGRPDHVVDIGAIRELDTITAGDDGLRIGALVRHARAERSDDVAAAAPLVHEALPWVGHRAIRSQGTVVGSIAHADPAAEMPAVCLAAGATIEARSTAGTRTIDAADFFDGYLTTTLQPDELLTSVQFPTWPSHAVGSVVEVARRHGDYALVGLVTKLEINGDAVTDAALSFFGAASTPVRVAEAEQSLVGGPATAERFDAAAAIVSDALSPAADIHATSAYRKHLAGVLTRRGLARAADKIGVAA
ncbi:MAG: xanthine dehydrogenase family protein subunit M [Ilumatobacter sp.]|uniref:FAD binding domain-containing protein n=1 Tax=Ilumatobacter sp. TaxID=1967498 RepID=UPI002610C1A7|nr:xanthine dehydrogenase family protein subunit M [Ilumatobacter sp.]MDJ0769622.1 xanthine dehydrogenase family protein subunit M [Ilumatobacter sp.]